MTERLISVVLPVHNQADHIAEVVRDYDTSLDRAPDLHEFVLVVNGSRDESLETCQRLAASLKTVRVLESAAGGWGHAVRLGLAEARGDVLCYANSARTSPADLLLLVLYAVANPAAVIKPHRRSRASLKRKLGSFIFNLQGRVLFDLPTWDINATPKIFGRDLYNAIKLTSDGDLIDLQFYLECQRIGAVVLEVPIYRWHRAGGESTTNYRSALAMYLGAWNAWREMRRAGPRWSRVIP